MVSARNLSILYRLMIVFVSAADQSRIMQEQMAGPAAAMPQDPRQAFKVSVDQRARRLACGQVKNIFRVLG